MVGASFMVDTPYYFMYGKRSGATAMIYDKQIPKKNTLRSAIKTIEAYNTIINTNSKFINSFVS